MAVAPTIGMNVDMAEVSNLTPGSSIKGMTILA